jgi:predicted dehydrogenase
MRRAARVEVVAIASRDGEQARAVAEAMEIPRSHGSYEALLADPDVDAVYIPLPNHLHHEWTIAAARAGKHVLCEKPLALTESEAQEMATVCDAAGVLLMEAFMYRHHPSWSAVRELVASGRIGQLKTVQSWFSYYNDDPTNIRNVQAFGGGALYDIGCYNVNLSRLLFGAEPTGVTASMERDPASGVDVLTSAILDFDEGSASFTCATRLESDQRVHIYGSAGRISIGIPFNIPPELPTRIFVTAGGDPPVAPATETIEFPAADPYGVMADVFATAVLDGTPLPFQASDAVANMRVIDGIFAAVAAR